MPISDDEKFEGYLKEFRPLAAEPLQTEQHRVAAPRPVMVAAWTSACAAVLVLTFLLLSQRAKPPQSTDGNRGHSGAQPLTNHEQLTLGRANSLLAHAESYKSAVDRISSRSQDARQEGKTSAFAVLGKENNKL
jgi:hypothetical protein